MSEGFSDYLVFVDESGDHGLDAIDPGYPMFVLAFCVIRKDQGAFAFLKTREKKQAFLDELTAIVAAMPFTLICSVIRKDHLRAKYVDPDNPYHIALGFGLERVFYYLRDKGAVNGKTHVMVEKRGKREDGELELEFRRVCDGGNYKKEQLPFGV